MATNKPRILEYHLVGPRKGTNYQATTLHKFVNGVLKTAAPDFRITGLTNLLETRGAKLVKIDGQPVDENEEVIANAGNPEANGPETGDALQDMESEAERAVSNRTPDPEPGDAEDATSGKGHRTNAADSEGSEAEVKKPARIRRTKEERDAGISNEEALEFRASGLTIEEWIAKRDDEDDFE